MKREIKKPQDGESTRRNQTFVPTANRQRARHADRLTYDLRTGSVRATLSAVRDLDSRLRISNISTVPVKPVSPSDNAINR